MDIDAAGLDVLSADQCFELLATVSVGRVGVHARALPVVLPVAFALDGESIVIRVGEGTQLQRASRDRVVAFEADYLDDATGTAWSVSVTGMATEITEPFELARARRLRLDRLGAWADDHFVRISPHFVTGRRRRASASVPPSSAARPAT